MALSQAGRGALIVAVVAGSFLPGACGRKDQEPRLVQYLKAEQKLRQRAVNAALLDDSLRTLQVEFAVDLDRELRRLREHPERWPDLLRALSHGD